MQVVAEDHVVDDLEVLGPIRGLDCVDDDLRAALGTQIADSRLHAQGQVHGMPRFVLRPRHVRYTWSAQPRMRARPRPPRSLTLSAPRFGFRKSKLELPGH